MNLFWIHFGGIRKSRDHGWPRRRVGRFARIKVYVKVYVGTSRPRLSAGRRPAFAHAVLLGRTVKSRTWVRMLDICIPFSCDTNGRISAMN